MGQLLVRDLDDEVIRRLKQRAALHGRSVEAEHRLILEEAVKPPAESPRDVARRFRAELAGTAPAVDTVDLLRSLREERLYRGLEG